MPLINTSVPNLIQGVSQQPDSTRFIGQCEEQENALSSVADGLKKRPNTRHIAQLMNTALDEDNFIHFIDRSPSERYVLIHNGTSLEAWNIETGVQATINGSTSYTPPSGSYLDTDPELLKGLTVADTTFVLDTSRAVALDTNKSPALAKEALVFIKQGDYEKKYQVDVKVNITNPVGFTDATATATLSRYVWRRTTRRTRAGTYTTNYYRWRITGVSVTSAGSGYYAIPSVSFSSNYDVYTNAVYEAALSGTGVGSISEVNQGDYEGAGTRGEDPPTITVTITPTTDGPTGGIDISHYIWSGSSLNSEHANTDRIAMILTGEVTADFNSGIDNPFNAGAASKVDDYFDVTRKGGLIRLTKKNTWEGDFTITSTDSLANTGMDAVYKETSDITNLPSKCFDGFRVKVIGSADLDQDDYYVEFKSADGADYGEGSWVETLAPDVELGFNTATMPVSFVSVDENAFEFRELDFTKRNAGDLASNPNPSFVGRTIANLFFFKDRLGFLSDDNVILSEAGLGAFNENGIFQYNLFRTTVTSLLDSGPIDVTVSSPRVSRLTAAVGLQENLVLFTDNGQYILKGGDLLTPKTVSVTPATNFNYDTSVEPAALGSYVYYPFERGSFTGMREFSVNATSDTYDSIEVTEHVPAYIPSQIIELTGTTSENIIALLSAEENNALYVYNYFWNNNQKLLSAWHKFTFTGEIRSIKFMQSTLYLVIAYNDETHLVEMPVDSGLSDDAGYVTHLDMRVAATVTDGSDTITLPYTPEDDSVEVYTTDGLKLGCTNVGETVTLTQAVTADTDVWIGIPYLMKYTFSEQLFKAQAGNGRSPSNAAKLMIRNGSIYFDDTAYFQVKVTPKARNASVNTFTPDVVGASTIGSLSLDSGFYRFPVFTKAQDTTITIENDSALPSNFQNAEFESFLHSRSNRYG